MKLLIVILLTVAGLSASAQTDDTQRASAHRRGPHGLEGWTLNETVPEHGDERYPVTLVIARHGRVLQRVEGGPFVWNWMFQKDGQQIAYESGPFHFGLTCVLEDVATGAQLGTYDCFSELPADAPAWVKALETSSGKAQ